MMTEEGWRRTTNPAAMIGFVGEAPGARKLRLFACACCRAFWHLLTDPRSRAAVDVAEQFADGLCGGEELFSTGQAATRAADEQPPNTRTWALAEAASWVAASWPIHAVARQAAERAAWVANTAPRGKQGRLGRAERRLLGSTQATLLRDIVANPFRPLSIDPAWQNPTVRSIARAVYDQRAFDRLPILADALEDAGCTDAVILDHLRGRGPHVLGCFALDLVLGKS